LDDLKEVFDAFSGFSSKFRLLLTILASYIEEVAPTTTDSQRVNKLSRIRFNGEFRRAFSQQAMTQTKTMVPMAGMTTTTGF
jgi:hypothetical protein